MQQNWEKTGIFGEKYPLVRMVFDVFAFLNLCPFAPVVFNVTL